MKDPYEVYKVKRKEKSSNETPYTTHVLASGVYSSVETILMAYLARQVIPFDGIVLSLEHDGILVWSKGEPLVMVSKVNFVLEYLSQSFLEVPISAEVKNIWTQEPPF